MLRGARFFAIAAVLVAAATLGVTPAEATTLSGCFNGRPAINDQYTLGDGEASGPFFQAWGCDFHGHYHIWGPTLDVNSQDGDWVRIAGTALYPETGHGNLCAEAWENIGYWHSIGWRCISV